MTEGRKIHCHICGQYVGIIRDAKLMKGIAFLCRDCAQAKTKTPDGGPVVDFLKGIMKC